jgi:hypothetical protein
MIKENNVSNKTINIFSDSRAALFALGKNLITSRTVKETVESLQSISKNNKVTLSWIPAHSGYVGNEIADLLAKNANKWYRGFRYTRVPKSIIKLNNNNLLKERSKLQWDSQVKMKHSKEFIVDYDANRKKELLKMNRKQITLISGFLTGHFATRYMLKKKRIIEDDMCRYCEAHAETAKHLLCDCIGLSHKRLVH